MKTPSQEIPFLQRDTPYRIEKLSAKVTLVPEAGSIFGTATYIVKPLSSLRQISFAASNLIIHQVFDSSGHQLEFSTRGDSVCVTAISPLCRNCVYQITIKYEAQPKSGLFFQPSDEHPDDFYIFTCSEGGLSANWIPSYAGMNQKFSFDLQITVPQGYSAISNGCLQGPPQYSEKETTWHYFQEKPCSPHLLALYAGKFEKGVLPSFGDIPVNFWVPKGQLAEGFSVFANTTNMIAYFSKIIGFPYPWDKYDQIAVPNLHTIGALENNSITGHNSSILKMMETTPNFTTPTFEEYHTDWTTETTMAHELAHHWFGNLVTAADLGHIWIHEAFATYLMILWVEESKGHNDFLFSIELARQHYFDFVKNKNTFRPLEYHELEAPEEAYDVPHVYLKGAAVLHSLRGIIGDELFFKSVECFVKRHAYANVKTNDLIDALEEVSGKDFSWFFKQWVLGGGHPKLDVSYRYLAQSKKVELHISQSQILMGHQGIFRLPIKISLMAEGFTSMETVWLEKDSETFNIYCPTAPKLVQIDPDGDLIAEINFPKGMDELLYQIEHDQLLGKLWAMRQIAAQYPHRKEVRQRLISLATSNSFWGVMAEATLLLGVIRHADCLDVLRQSLQNPNPMIRRAGLLALGKVPGEIAAGPLLSHLDTEVEPGALGILVMSLCDQGLLTPELMERLLLKPSWYGTIQIACLEAIKKMGDPKYRDYPSRFTGPNCNQNVRSAALEAWSILEPEEGALHQTLASIALTAPYQLRLTAIGLLGTLKVSDSKTMLNQIVTENYDKNLTEKAKSAVKQIETVSIRIEP